MPKIEQNNEFTRTILAEVRQYTNRPEYAIIRELCALYDHFCDCIAVVEQRLYLRKRIEHYKEILINERTTD